MKRTFFLGFLVFALCSCAGNVSVRNSPDGSPVSSSSSDTPYLDIEHYRTTLSGEPGENSAETGGFTKRRHSIAYIEFDEQGDFLNRNQLIDALKEIPTGPNRLIVFYAHGWQNNTRSADVAKFNALLAHLSHTLNEKSEAQGKGLPWQIYGIYLGWRGTLFDPSDEYPAQPAFQECSIADILKKPRPSPYNDAASLPKQFTFWSRKDAAGRLAGAPLLETINMISARARTLSGPPHQTVNTKVILIGHSFGAYVIEKTVLQSITTQTPVVGADQKSYITPPADLVILLNSAAPAIYAKEFIEFLKWHSVKQAKPFVISVSSEGDWATEDLFPAGTILASAFDVGSYQGKDTYNGANEKSFFTHTPGHTAYLASFDACPTGEFPFDHFSSDRIDQWIFYRNLVPKDFKKTEPRFLAWGGSFAKSDVGDPAQIWQLTPTQTVDPSKKPFNDTPYWLIRVPTSIIADHGDVWCPNSMNLLTALVRLSGIADSGPNWNTLTLNPEVPPKNGSDQLEPLLGYGKERPSYR